MIPFSATIVRPSLVPITSNESSTNGNTGAKPTPNAAIATPNAPTTSHTGSLRAFIQRPAADPITDPVPQHEMSSANPIAREWNDSARAASATIPMPIPSRKTNQASDILRSTRSRQRNVSPAAIPACSSSPSAVARSAWNRPRTVSVSTSETTNETAFRPNTHDASPPVMNSRTPPIAGPIAIPACTPIVTRLFAQERSSSDSTRFGIAAREAEKNGSSAIAEPNASAINTRGPWPNAIAAKKAAETASDTTMTLRRSKRSPRAPAKGPSRPATPNVSSRDIACISGECV